MIHNRNNSYHADVVIIGGGIIGLSIAYELIKQEDDVSVIILEKEPELGAHGSGRNSGVLHSGIYYPESSLKAKFCSDGAKAMSQYCFENNLPAKRIGKVILPIQESDADILKLLLSRSKANGANASIVDNKQLHEIEPEAYSITGDALYSPDTSVVDPLLILTDLAKKIKGKNGRIFFNEKVIDASPESNYVKTNKSIVNYKYLFNASGQNTDQTALLFGVGKQYTMIPFKGSYFKLKNKETLKLNGLIYPAPDLDIPFLGVHSIKTVSGDIYFGPNAVPALGRENYNGFEGASYSEALNVGYQLFLQYIKNKQGIRKYFLCEATRLIKPNFIKAIQQLIPKIKSSDLMPSDKKGIRAQLLDKDKSELVMDFVVEKKENTTHILNAVSPAFTSAFSFAKYVINNYSKI